MVSASITLVRSAFRFTVTIPITHLEIGEHRREIKQYCQNIIEIQPFVKYCARLSCVNLYFTRQILD